MTTTARRSRLGAYAATATAATIAHADIQVYDGPPITLETGPIGLDFGTTTQQFWCTRSGWESHFSSGDWVCCNYTQTSWGSSFCTWSTWQGFSEHRFIATLEISRGDLDRIQFLQHGDPVGRGGAALFTSVCSSGHWQSAGCSNWSNFNWNDCDEPRSWYVGFTTTDWRSGMELRGWMLIEGSDSTDLAITSWAYEDTGGSIDAGQTVADTCDGDLNGDDQVNSADLGLLTAAWGDCTCTADLTGDGTVDAADLGLLVAAWGGCG